MRPAPRSREASERPGDPQSVMAIKQPPVQWHAGEVVFYMHIHIHIPAPPKDRLLKGRAALHRVRVPSRSQRSWMRSRWKLRAGAGWGSCGSRVRGAPALG